MRVCMLCNSVHSSRRACHLAPDQHNSLSNRRVLCIISLGTSWHQPPRLHSLTRCGTQVSPTAGSQRLAGVGSRRAGIMNRSPGRSRARPASAFFNIPSFGGASYGRVTTSLDDSAWVAHRLDRDGDRLGWTDTIPTYSLGGAVGPQSNSRYRSGQASSFNFDTRDSRARLFTDPIRDKRDNKGQAPVAAYHPPDDTMVSSYVPSFGVGDKLPWPTTGSPGPGTYETVGSVGPQPLSLRKTEASCGWASSTMTREKYAVQFVSRRLAEFKKGSRDPGQYRPPVSSLGKQVDHYATAPGSFFGSSTAPRFEGGELLTVTNTSRTHSRQPKPRGAPTYSAYSWRVPEGIDGVPYQGPYVASKGPWHSRSFSGRSLSAGRGGERSPVPTVRIPPPSPSPRGTPAARTGLVTRRVPNTPDWLMRDTATPPPNLHFDEEALPTERKPRTAARVAASPAGRRRAEGGAEVPTTSPAFRFGTPEHRILSNFVARLAADAGQ